MPILGSNPALSGEEDVVNKPKHYQSPFKTLSGHFIQSIDVATAWRLSANIFTCLRYLLRSGRKDPAKELEDYKKARFYLDLEIQLLESGHYDIPKGSIVDIKA